MNRNNIVACALAAISGALADTLVLPPPATASGEDVAIVWIHGASCENSAYTSFANEVQSQGASNGQKIWVGLPEFIFSTPEPLLIDHYVTETISKLREAGFEGDNILLAAHSLGGVMAQNYAKDHSDLIKGQVLMGSVLLRDKHSITDDGYSLFDYQVPTLTLGGTKDGLMRVTRLAEAYWHQVNNIEATQKNLFPIYALEGGSHMSFMSGEAPKNVKNHDLRADVDESTAHQTFATQMVSFIDQVLKQSFTGIDSKTTPQVMKGLVEAIELEGNYQLKPPCYGHETENPDVPTCFHGNPWTNMVTQITMGGTFANSHISVVNDDNFHRVQSIDPVHLPSVETTCDKNTKTDCVLKSITVSENKYDFLDELDTGFYPVSASEIKTKLNSRQRVQQKAGYEFSDFHEDDEVGNRCAEINQIAIDWGYDHLSKQAKQNYDNFGEKLVVGTDKGPYNEGPLWIWTFMDYTENSDKTQMTVQSAMMRTPTDYFIQSAAGFHYCKVLSPFKVLEHMYVDGLFAHDSLKNTSSNSAEILFLQE